jgi:D-glycero-D-manno-heptose 1,7-bisphosphate phosphatase
LCDSGFLIFVVTNQRGIARRMLDPQELEKIHHDLLRKFSDAGAPVSKIYVCPHEGGCECRKPAPGMLLRAAKEYDVDLEASWMIGDSLSDVEAGKRAGCRAVRILEATVEPSLGLSPDLEARDLPEAVKQIVKATP